MIIIFKTLSSNISINSSDQEEQSELALELMNDWNMIVLSLPCIVFHECADFTVLL